MIEFGMALPDEPDEAVHIVAFDLGDAGCANADDGGFGAVGDGDDCLLDVLIAAEHGGHFAHGRRLHRDGFAKMAHENHKPERGAALRAMQKRHAVLDAEEGERAAERLAHLQRVDGAGFFGGYDLCHLALTLPGFSKVWVPRRPRENPPHPVLLPPGEKERRCNRRDLLPLPTASAGGCGHFELRTCQGEFAGRGLG